MSDLISRKYMKSLGATCIASRSKDGTLFPIVAIDELPPADLTYETPSNALGALDCVDRQDAMKIRFSSGFDHDGILYVPYRDVEEHLKKLPSVQPKERCIATITLREEDLERIAKEQAHMQVYADGQKPREGKWIDYSDEGYVECPFCHSATNCDGNKDDLHYCFSCGAELR